MIAQTIDIAIKKLYRDDLRDPQIPYLIRNIVSGFSKWFYPNALVLAYRLKLLVKFKLILINSK